jgi:hypothetical protein
MKKLLPLLLALLGLGGGTAAGFLLKPQEPAPPPAAAPCGEQAEAAPEPSPAGEEQEGRDYVKLNNQFVVPVIKGGQVAALVVMSLSLEVSPGMREAIYEREPKLRDVFLQVLFDHANVGGFDGNFTRSDNLRNLRRALLEVARKAVGESVSDVLVIDMVRQDA